MSGRGCGIRVAPGFGLVGLARSALAERHRRGARPAGRSRPRSRKRVSLQYRPLPAAEATRVLEAEVNAAAFRQHYRRRTGRDETARYAYDQAWARQSAAEEAMGAGVCLLALYVTVTGMEAGRLMPGARTGGPCWQTPRPCWLTRRSACPGPGMSRRRAGRCWIA